MMHNKAVQINNRELSNDDNAYRSNVKSNNNMLPWDEEERITLTGDQVVLAFGLSAAGRFLEAFGADNALTVSVKSTTVILCNC